MCSRIVSERIMSFGGGEKRIKSKDGVFIKRTAQAMLFRRADCSPCYSCILRVNNNRIANCWFGLQDLSPWSSESFYAM